MLFKHNPASFLILFMGVHVCMLVCEGPAEARRGVRCPAGGAAACCELPGMGVGN